MRRQPLGEDWAAAEWGPKQSCGKHWGVGAEPRMADSCARLEENSASWTMLDQPTALLGPNAGKALETQLSDLVSENGCFLALF